LDWRITCSRSAEPLVSPHLLSTLGNLFQDNPATPRKRPQESGTPPIQGLPTDWKGRPFAWLNQSDPWDYRNKRHRYRYEMGVDNRVRAARISQDARPPVSSNSGKHGVLRTCSFPAGCFQKGEKEYLGLFFPSSTMPYCFQGFLQHHTCGHAYGKQVRTYNHQAAPRLQHPSTFGESALRWAHVLGPDA
jgi:hypothetical protein